MIFEAIVCVGGLIFFTLVVEYLTREKPKEAIVQYSRGHVPHPIVPEPNNLLEDSE